MSCISLMALLACNNTKQSQKQISTKHTTEITFEKSTHAFGQIKGGETVGCYFSFTNSGEHPLVINQVKPGCGCTTVKFPQEPILAGEKGEIEIRFDSSGFSGHQYKVVQVFANIENKIKELVISANVIN
ncbi:DUF1573 domain-containing protein [Labilibacter marinus]|uniref:DUF1573 domain-containing protein n=1 Tax=Labilibacter marinus TaxID=1477105 RepID=UPI00117BDC2E|nr:DUF1573 domain-containing protein [Labilibacter marinus]